MPAPNLGLVGAYGAAGVQKAIQDMVAERRAAEQLAFEQTEKTRQYELSKREAENLNRHRQALEQYQLGDLEVRRQAASRQEAPSVIELRSFDPNTQTMWTRGVNKITGQELWKTETPEAPKQKTGGFQSETKLLKGVPTEVGYDPETNQYFHQGKPVDVQPLPKEVDPLLGAIREQTIAMNRQILNQDLPPNVQKRVDHYGDQFQGDPVVKRFNVVATANRFLQSMPDTTTNPADHQAFIYTFAKASDPDSAVRGEEYDIIAKYAQSWKDKFGFDLKRIMSGAEILTPQAIQNIKANVATKLGAERQGYNQIRNEFAQQIDLATGKTDGTNRLVQFDVGASRGPASVEPGAAAGKFKAIDPAGKEHTFDSQAAADIAKKGWADYEARRKGGGGR